MARRDTAFAAYVEERRPQLYRAAYFLCGDPDRAEDVLQTALAKLYVAWHRASRADNVDAYVRRALVNAHIDDGQRAWRRHERSSDDLTLHARTTESSQVEQDDELFAALRALPPGQRRVVVLRHYWELSVQETAAELGISTGTVKSQTSAALASLRTILTTEGAR